MRDVFSNSLRRTLQRIGLPLSLAIVSFTFSAPALQSASIVPPPALAEDADGPVMLHPQLAVRGVVSGLVTPVSLAFVGRNDLLVLEKNTGRVQRVTNGVMQTTVLDLAVNFASERGLLGIALHPDFPANPRVYLYWTESSTATDTDVLADTPLLGNRVDRFHWTGSALTFDRNITKIRAIQQDRGQPEQGNHDGGMLAFGPDRKLYIFIGDVGRRGQLQNLPCGPTAACPGTTVADDQFGGPAPDSAHLTGVMLRLNDDGSTPADNPFVSAGEAIGGEVGANIQKIFSYGHRNSIGMAFDPVSAALWLQENGGDSFSELNRVPAGMNGGWVQISGPAQRLAQYQEIETAFGAQSRGQQRWPPTNIASTPSEALSRLFMLPGGQYHDPEFSWKWDLAPGGVGFMTSLALGPEFQNDLFMGAATAALEGGYLFRFKLTSDRQHVAVSDSRIADGVADNLRKHEITESESLLIGRNFGAVTDIKTGPNGNLFVVSLTRSAIYEISAANTPLAAGYTVSPPAAWTTDLSGTYNITVTNSGTQTWSATGDNRVLLGVHFGGAGDGPHADWATDERFTLPNDVAPGGSVTLSIAVTAPATEGSYVLRHRMVQEGVAWFDQIDKTNVIVARPSLGARYSASPPAVWIPGQSQTYSVTVTNTGTQTWLAAGANRVRLGVHFGGADDGTHMLWATDQRFTLPNDVAPGGSATLSITVTAPAREGSHVLRHRMVQEGVAWFTHIYKTNVFISPAPRAAGYTVGPPMAWTAGQSRTYSITVSNTGAQPWSAAGANRVQLGVHFGTSVDNAHAGWATDLRFALPHDVAPGSSATLSIAVTAPPTAGSYVLRHRMLQDGVAWFAQIDKTSVTVGG